MTAKPLPHRIGQPSPLPLHLAAAAFTYQQALSLAPNLGKPEFPWHPDLAAKAEGLAPPEPMALLEEVHDRLTKFLDGVKKWQYHPFRRDDAEVPHVWAQGSARLRRYGEGSGVPVLVVPSLINRSYILDILPETSMLRFLAGRGLDVYLLDWGHPGYEERDFSLNDYIEKLLVPAARFLRKETGHAPSILGYCMGGTLSVGAIAKFLPDTPSLTTLGSPWDFSQSSGTGQMLRALAVEQGPELLHQWFTRTAQIFGFIPVEIFQSLFFAINPLQAALKFRDFAALDPASDSARKFVAVEDWLADGVPMAGPAAEQLLVAWNVENATATGEWILAGEPVQLREIQCPSMIIYGTRDSITPCGTAKALADGVKSSVHLTPEIGHVGMICGSRAPTEVWEPAAKFIRKHAEIA